MLPFFRRRDHLLSEWEPEFPIKFVYEICLISPEKGDKEVFGLETVRVDRQER
jgi:hypothetical protein